MGRGRIQELDLFELFVGQRLAQSHLFGAGLGQDADERADTPVGSTNRPRAEIDFDAGAVFDHPGHALLRKSLPLQRPLPDAHVLFDPFRGHQRELGVPQPPPKTSLTAVPPPRSRTAPYCRERRRRTLRSSREKRRRKRKHRERQRVSAYIHPVRAGS